jgi:hypothetical protein
LDFYFIHSQDIDHQGKDYCDCYDVFNSITDCCRTCEDVIEMYKKNGEKLPRGYYHGKLYDPRYFFN